MGIYGDLEVTPEEEAEYIRKTAEKIHQYGMETPAILLLESSKPLVWVGGELGRFFVSPFIPVISEDWGVKSEKFLRIFEQRSNVERLLKTLELFAEEDERRKDEEKRVKRAAEDEVKRARRAAEGGVDARRKSGS